MDINENVDEVNTNISFSKIKIELEKISGDVYSCIIEGEGEQSNIKVKYNIEKILLDLNSKLSLNTNTKIDYLKNNVVLHQSESNLEINVSGSLLENRNELGESCYYSVTQKLT